MEIVKRCDFCNESKRVFKLKADWKYVNICPDCSIKYWNGEIEIDKNRWGDLSGLVNGLMKRTTKRNCMNNEFLY